MQQCAANRLCSMPEASQINNKEGRNVVRLPAQVLFPEALLPEPEALHVLVVVAEWCEAKWCTLHQHPIITQCTVWYSLVQSGTSIVHTGCHCIL